MEPFTTVACDDGGFDTLSDDEVVERVKDLAAAERRASVALIRSLVEFDARRLYLREGCSSLFTYCTQVLHLSEVSTYNRIETARAARHYPRVLEALECGDVTLTAVRLLAPHLTAANHEEMLVAARHKSKQQIQELIASLSPRPAAPTVIRRIPSRTGTAPPIATPPRQDTSETASAGTLVRCATGRDAGPAIVPHALAAAAVTPLAAEHYKLQVTLSRETHEKLRRAQALARHALPDGDIGTLLDRALTLLIDHLERRRFAQASAPRPSGGEGTAAGRHIPAVLSSVRCGSAIRDVARSSGAWAVAARPASSSSTTSRPTPQGEALRRTISSSAAVRTISMRHGFSLGICSCASGSRYG